MYLFIYLIESRFFLKKMHNCILSEQRQKNRPQLQLVKLPAAVHQRTGATINSIPKPRPVLGSLTHGLPAGCCGWTPLNRSDRQRRCRAMPSSRPKPSRQNSDMPFALCKYSTAHELIFACLRAYLLLKAVLFSLFANRNGSDNCPCCHAGVPGLQPSVFFSFLFQVFSICFNFVFFMFALNEIQKGLFCFYDKLPGLFAFFFTLTFDWDTTKLHFLNKKEKKKP